MVGRSHYMEYLTQTLSHHVASIEIVSFVLMHWNQYRKYMMYYFTVKSVNEHFNWGIFYLQYYNSVDEKFFKKRHSYTNNSFVNILLTCILTFELVNLKFEHSLFFMELQNITYFLKGCGLLGFADCIKVEAVARIKCFFNLLISGINYMIDK